MKKNVEEEMIKEKIGHSTVLCIKKLQQRGNKGGKKKREKSEERRKEKKAKRDRPAMTNPT